MSKFSNCTGFGFKETLVETQIKKFFSPRWTLKTDLTNKKETIVTEDNYGLTKDWKVSAFQDGCALLTHNKI